VILERAGEGQVEEGWIERIMNLMYALLGAYCVELERMFLGPRRDRPFWTYYCAMNDFGMARFGSLMAPVFGMRGPLL